MGSVVLRLTAGALGRRRERGPAQTVSHAPGDLRIPERHLLWWASGSRWAGADRDTRRERAGGAPPLADPLPGAPARLRPRARHTPRTRPWQGQRGAGRRGAHARARAVRAWGAGRSDRRHRALPRAGGGDPPAAGAARGRRYAPHRGGHGRPLSRGGAARAALLVPRGRVPPDALARRGEP